MRTTVSIRAFEEDEIRTRTELDELQQLASKEIPVYFQAGTTQELHTCPACDATHVDRLFTKCSLAYDRCRSCQTIFASARPDDKALEAYYRHSEAARFWREHIQKAGRQARRTKIGLPNAQWIHDSLAEHRPGATVLVDISSNGRDHVEALIARMPGLDAVVAAHPLADLDYDGGVPKPIRLRPSSFEVRALPGPCDAVLALEFLDRTISPPSLFQAAWNALRPGGLLFMTFPCASGFDVQVLHDEWPALIPPDRLTIPTTEGIQALMGRQGWKLLELSTPGMFDVETVRQAVRSQPGRPWPDFVRYLVEGRSQQTRLAFQEFLQAHRMSSYGRLLLQRPEER